MLSRGFRKEESLARYWAKQAIELCYDIDDESLIERSLPIEQAISQLERDRRIIFIGNSKSGKSSLLAAVAQYPAIRNTRMEHEYLCWRYRSTDGDATCSAFIPRENLEGLELTDTACCAVPENRDIIVSLMQASDVIIGVMDARAAEESAVWELLNTLPQNRRHAALITVTHTDKLGAEEALQLKEKLRTISRKKLNTSPSIHFICPTTLKGVDSFIQRIQEALEEPHGLKGDIRQIIDSAGDLLNKQFAILRTREAISDNNNNFLKQINNEIDLALADQMEDCGIYANAYAEAAVHAIPQTLSAKKKAFGWWLSPVTLMRMELFGAGAELHFYRSYCDHILKKLEEDDHSFVALCQEHWNLKGPIIKKEIECDIGAFPNDALNQDLEGIRNRFVCSIHRHFEQEKILHQMNDIFLNSAQWMKYFILGICLCLTVAGILGYFNLTFPACWLMLCCIPLWLLGTLYHRFVASHTNQQIIKMAEQLRTSMQTDLVSDIHQLFISRMAAYRKLYTEPQNKVARNKALLAPIKQEVLNATRQLSSVMHRR